MTRADTHLNRLIDQAEESGEPSPSCNQCQHFRQRFDEGSFMGRCAQRDEVQFQFGICNDFNR